MNSLRTHITGSRAAKLRLLTGIAAVAAMPVIAVTVGQTPNTTWSHSSINTVGISTPYTTPTTPSMNMGATVAPSTAPATAAIASASPAM